MPTTYTEPFSGQVGSTCSVATAHAAKNGEAYKKAGMTEAKWSSMDMEGGWQVFKTKLAAGEIEDKQIIGAFKHPQFGTFKGSWNEPTGTIKLRCVINGPLGPGKGQFLSVKPGAIDGWIKTPGADIKWAGTKAVKKIEMTPPPGLTNQEGWDIVFQKLSTDISSLGGNVLGTVTTPDFGTMEIRWNAVTAEFDMTVVKASLALQKGEVLSIGPSNFKQFWVDSKVKKIEWQIKTETKAEQAVASTGKLTDEDVAQMFVKIKDDIAKELNINIKGANPILDNKVFEKIAKQTGYKALEVKQKIDRYKASGKKLSALKKKTLGKTSKVEVPKTAPKPPADAPKVDPTLVPSQATVDKVVNEVVKNEDAMSLALSYTDEDVAKAYVRAKDKVVADSNGKWTLYSKSDELDNAVFAQIRKELPNIANQDIKQQVARYISEVKKLSQLKKDLIKKGQLNAKAPTLKGPKTLAEQATEKNGVKEAVVENPKVEIFDFTSEKTYVYNLTQQANIALSDTPDVLYKKLLDVSRQLTKNKSHFSALAGYKDADVLSLARLVDAKKAEIKSVWNTHAYENMLTNWIESGQGKAFILKQKEMAKLAEKAASDLPADSELFKIVTPEQASSTPMDARNVDVNVRSAAKKYTGSSYVEINTALRNGSRSLTANTLDNGMVTFDRNMLLHRGTVAQNFGVRTNDELFGLVGKTISDKGFTSTSVGGRAAFSREVIMEIEAPKGVARGLYVDNISQHRGEKELVLASGTRFKVLRVFRDGHKIIVRVRVVR